MALFAFNPHSRAGLRRILVAIFSQEDRSHLIEQLLDSAAVLQSALERRNHIRGHIQATPPALLGEGQQVVGVLVPAGAGRAVGPDAGLAHQGQRTFEGRP